MGRGRERRERADGDGLLERKPGEEKNSAEVRKDKDENEDSKQVLGEAAERTKDGEKKS